MTAARILPGETGELFFVVFGPQPGGSQSLLLALYSEMTPGGLRGPYGGRPAIEPRLAVCKANALPVVLLLWPPQRLVHFNDAWWQNVPKKLCKC